jgi:hypothetical protein
VTQVKVRAVREGRLWVLHLEDGVTQVRNLGDVEAMVADYVSLLRGIPAEDIEVDLVEIDPGADLAQEVDAARKAQKAAATAMEAAAGRVRQAALDLKRRGLTGVEVGRVLGVSPQRVSQLTKLDGASARGTERDTHTQPTPAKVRSKRTPRRP